MTARGSAADAAVLRRLVVLRTPRPSPPRRSTHDHRGHHRLLERGRSTFRAAPVHSSLSSACNHRLPHPRRGRPDHLPVLRLRPAGLPELRQGDGPLLPRHRVPDDDAELDAHLGCVDREVPLLLPSRRRPPLRAHRRPPPAARLREHLRVLLHRLRARAHQVGSSTLRTAVVAPHGCWHLDPHQAPPGVLDPHRQARPDGRAARRPVVRPSPGGSAARPGRRAVVRRAPTTGPTCGSARGTPWSASC